MRVGVFSGDMGTSFLFEKVFLPARMVFSIDSDTFDFFLTPLIFSN